MSEVSEGLLNTGLFGRAALEPMLVVTRIQGAGPRIWGCSHQRTQSSIAGNKMVKNIVVHNSGNSTISGEIH
jgi:hypothetical protein